MTGRRVQVHPNKMQTPPKVRAAIGRRLVHHWQHGGQGGAQAPLTRSRSGCR